MTPCNDNYSHGIFINGKLAWPAHSYRDAMRCLMECVGKDARISNLLNKNVTIGRLTSVNSYGITRTATKEELEQWTHMKS